MGFYSLDLDELSEYTDISIPELKNKSYKDLESMIQTMKKNKIIEQNNRNIQDTEYERLVLKFFEPLKFLRHWFDDKEIVLACALTGVTINNLCSEQFVKPGTGRTFWEKYGEYLRTSVEFVPQYDVHGRELMERAHKQMDVYRVSNKYQHLQQGNVIKHLLYERYPELAKFDFKIYGFIGEEHDYEIYPNNHIYTSFTAMMSGDIDWILYRNREYCKTYNNGIYTPDECEKTFRTNEAFEMFDLIRRIGEQERTAGHFPINTDENGKLVMTNGLKETSTSISGNIKILKSSGKSPFKLDTAAPYATARLIEEFLSMIDDAKVDVHIYHITDYLGEHGFHVKDITKRFKNIDNRLNKYSGYAVHNIFGWVQGNKYDLTIRINCPEMLEA